MQSVMSRPSVALRVRRLRAASALGVFTCLLTLCPATVTAQSTGTSPAAAAPVPGTGKLAASALLQYEGHGRERGFFKYSGSGELRWSHEAGHYQAMLEITALGLRVRTWKSAGDLSPQGLLPVTFQDAPRGADWTTRFLRDKNVISFSSGTPDQPLLTGAQDKLSALLQLGVLLNNAPQRYGVGDVVQFQAADAHRAEPWNFLVTAAEPRDLPGGSVNAIKLTKKSTPDFDQQIQVWLAPDQDYLPVRLLITEPGENFIDLLWKKTQKLE